MKLTFLGHACFLLQTMDQKILFDPFISDNPAASDIDVDAIRCDYIVLTHGHGDHVADVGQGQDVLPDCRWGGGRGLCAVFPGPSGMDVRVGPAPVRGELVGAIRG